LVHADSGAADDQIQKWHAHFATSLLLKKGEDKEKE